MIILTKGIQKIEKMDNKLILTYGEERQANNAMEQIYEENADWYSREFPHGVFSDGELKEYKRLDIKF